MTTARKAKSNHANSRSSTGPKTANGRGRSAKNALRYGLSLPVLSDPLLSQEVAALARKIAGADTDPEVQDLARRVAEAEIDLAESGPCVMTSSPALSVIQITTLARTGTKK